MKEKGGKPNKNHTLPNGLRILYGHLKSENSQDYAQKPDWNCMFMNSASGEFILGTKLYYIDKSFTQRVSERSMGYVVFVLLISEGSKFM